MILLILIALLASNIESSPAFYRSPPRNISSLTWARSISDPKKALKAVPFETDVKFRLSAKDLEDKDRFGESDPYVIVSYLAERVDEEVVLGRTSTIQDSENPAWGESFRIRYKQGTKQRLHFAVWDRDAGADEPLADVTLRLSELVKNKGEMQIPLNPGILVIQKA